MAETLGGKGLYQFYFAIFGGFNFGNTYSQYCYCWCDEMRLIQGTVPIPCRVIHWFFSCSPWMGPHAIGRGYGQFLHKWYIDGIYCQLGDYMPHPTTYLVGEPETAIERTHWTLTSPRFSYLSTGAESGGDAGGWFYGFLGRYVASSSQWPIRNPWDEDVYLPTWMVDFYGIHVGKYTSSSHGVYGWNDGRDTKN